MTDKEFDAAIKVFEQAQNLAMVLSCYQKWARDAEPLAEQLQILIDRMKKV